MIIPDYVAKALNAASGACVLWVNNQQAQEWLCRNLGLVTDDNEHVVGDWTVDFCWKAQRWFVK